MSSVTVIRRFPTSWITFLLDPQRVRKGMKGMGESVGVPIEPDEQTRLLDACIQRAGVIGGGVPGGKSRSRLPVIS